MSSTESETNQRRGRTDRFRCLEGEWFCTLRGNQVIGPFSSKAEAQSELLFYLRENGFISSVESMDSLEEVLASGF